MENIFWILAAIAVAAIIIWYLTKRRKELTPPTKESEETEETEEPEEPTSPPETPTM